MRAPPPGPPRPTGRQEAWRILAQPGSAARSAALAGRLEASCGAGKPALTRPQHDGPRAFDQGELRSIIGGSALIDASLVGCEYPSEVVLSRCSKWVEWLPAQSGAIGRQRPMSPCHERWLHAYAA